ncbi:MAG: glycosyltransferase family 4 protein [Bacteroidota bacterium]
MKVAIVINTAWNIYNFRRGIVESLLSKGHQVLAIAPADDYVERLKALGCDFRHLSMAGSGINPIKDLILIFRFHRLLRAERPDVLLSYTIKPNIYGSFLSRVLKVPIICNVSGLGTVFMRKGVVPAIAMMLYRNSLTHADLVFFQNDEDQALFVSRVPLQPTRVQLLNGSGIDLNRFTPRPKPSSSPMTFLMIGRLISEKGIYEYAEAAATVKAKYPEARFQVLGGWDPKDRRAVSKEQLREWQAKDWVEYLGVTDDVREQIAQASAVVLPSYREGTPRTLLEAGAMGLPLLATDVPGCRHVVRDGYNGFLCEAKSGEALAQIILKFITLSASQQDEMGKNSRTLIEEKFDERLIVKSYTDAIKKLVQRPN